MITIGTLFPTLALAQLSRTQSIDDNILGWLFTFTFFAFFSGILGLILGAPFRILVVENNVIDSVIARMLFGFVFFPPVVGVVLMIGCLLFCEEPNLEAWHWGVLSGFTLGFIYSYTIAGRDEHE